jgi:hypothetical protein
MQWIKSARYNKPLFEIGKLIVTNDAMKYILQNSVELTRTIQKHQNGDWSHLSKWYQNSNRDAVKNHGYIVSSHTT